MAEDATGHVVEPWLRNTRQQTPPIPRAVLHALDLTVLDFARWVWPLREDQLEAEPFGLPSVGFQARHIARSLDRLLTYAEGRPLADEQHCALASEHKPATAEHTRLEFLHGIASAEQRILALPTAQWERPRYVGRAQLPVTLAALLVHLADHTQRHAGQAVTTAKLVAGLQIAEQS